MYRKYGRKTIYVNYTEEQLLSADTEQQKAIILSILPNVIAIHDENKADIQYLWDYYLGLQDILYKQKFTRKEINNKKVENWARAIIDFKKAWLLGNPIQYTMLNSSSSNEIEKLNRYCRYEGKEAKDQLIYEDILVTGRGFRYINRDKVNEDDEAPFEILNVDKENCEIVYSNTLGHEQLFALIETPMQEPVLNLETNMYDIKIWKEYTIYLRNKKFVLQYRDYSKTPFVFVDEKEDLLTLNQHIISEYYVNRDRISLIEVGKDLFDGINQLESLDFDDLEQFVNSIMVFTNAEVNEEELDEIKAIGAVNIKSTENKKASVEELKNRLNASETQVFYTRLLTSLHQILGMPMATDNGSVTSGDTGKAKMTGQGFTSAGIRVKTDETMLRDCDYNTLKIMLKICRENPNSEITTLKASDVDIKLNIDMSDNLLVKTQGLLNLLSADIPREFALPIINLFSDSNAVVKKMEENFGKQQSQQNGSKNGNTTNNNDLNSSQNNDITSNLQNDIQGK